MNVKARIISTIFAGTLLVGGMAAVPAAAAAAIPGPHDITNAPHCTHGCGGGGGGLDGPKDLTNPTSNPDPGDPGVGGTSVDVPIPASATFTG
jgi:hypothetical protein